MDKLFEAVANYGFSVLVIAFCVIAFIGILKLCKVFDKISNKEIKKCIYYVLNIALSFAGAAIYFAIFKHPFSGYLVFSLAQIGVTTFMYSIYEHLGLRLFVRWLFSCIAKWFKANPEHKFVKACQKFGLTSESINVVCTVAGNELTRTTNTENK